MKSSARKIERLHPGKKKKSQPDYMPKFLLRAFGLPEPVREFKFHPERKWMADFCFLRAKLIIEIEGGLFSYGRHNRAASMIKDMKKYNAMTELGYKLLRYIPSKIDFYQIKKIYDESVKKIPS